MSEVAVGPLFQDDRTPLLIQEARHVGSFDDDPDVGDSHASRSGRSAKSGASRCGNSADDLIIVAAGDQAFKLVIARRHKLCRC